jgi:hypothetical protein
MVAQGGVTRLPEADTWAPLVLDNKITVDVNLQGLEHLKEPANREIAFIVTCTLGSGEVTDKDRNTISEVLVAAENSSCRHNSLVIRRCHRANLMPWEDE